MNNYRLLKVLIYTTILVVSEIAFNEVYGSIIYF